MIFVFLFRVKILNVFVFWGKHWIVFIFWDKNVFWILSSSGKKYSYSKNLIVFLFWSPKIKCIRTPAESNISQTGNQTQASKTRRKIVLYFTGLYASFHPSHSDNAANVILLRKRLDALRQNAPEKCWRKNCSKVTKVFNKWNVGNCTEGAKNSAPPLRPKRANC